MTIHAKSELCKKSAPLHSKMENTVPTQVLARLLYQPSVIQSFPARNAICLCLLSTCTSWPRGKVYPPGLPLPFLSKLFIYFLIFLGMCQLLHPLHFSQTIRTLYHLRTCLYFPSTVEFWQATWSSLCQLYVLVLLVYITLPLMPKYH